MGHKVNPVGLRLGINRTWDSRWFAARGEYGKLLHEDRAIRAHILKQQRQAGIAKVVIERPHKKCRVTVYTARPGVLIGKKGADIEKLRGELARLTASEVHLNIVEIRKPEIDATRGMSQTTQCHHPETGGRYGSNMVTAKLFVPAGGLLHLSAGDWFGP